MVLRGYLVEERLFVVGFQIAQTGLVGYGLANRRGWQYYVFVVLMDILANYYSVLSKTGHFNVADILIWVIAFSVLTNVPVFWLCWRDQKQKLIPISDPPLIDSDQLRNHQ